MNRNAATSGKEKADFCRPELEEIRSACLKAGLAPETADSVARSLTIYLTLLLRWRQAINLTGPKNWPDIFNGLVLDSFALADFIKELKLPEQPYVLDLGAGAGLPGLPLRMIWQNGRYGLVEIREKRAAFLQTCLAGLDLPGTFVLAGKAEEALSKEQGKVDLIIARAFKPWPELLAMCASSLAPEGLAVIMSLNPPPDLLPQNWRLAASRAYAAPSAADKGKRYLWALARA